MLGGLMTRCCALVSCALVGFVSSVGTGSALAQEAILTDAATQPAKGRVTFRGQYRFTRLDQEARDGRQGRTVNDHAWHSTVTYGVRRDISFAASFAALVRDDVSGSPGAGFMEGPDDDEAGVTDLRTTLKWRFWQEDPGPVDTRRLALVGGIEWPTGTGDLSSHSIDPFAGIVFTAIQGRHGFNQSVLYQFNTGTIEENLLVGQNKYDLLEFDTAYLYRLYPGSYTDETEGSLYATVELEGYYETSGDVELLISPGLMWEARRWTAEVGVRLPLYEDVTERAAVGYGVVFGIRYLF